MLGRPIRLNRGFAMRLKTVRITEFKSVQDSGDIDIGDVTCLVGKNESGKTALLQALYRLNPLIPQQAVVNVTEDYPRIEVEDYQQDIEGKKRQPATSVRAVFELSPDEIAAIDNAFG